MKFLLLLYCVTLNRGKLDPFRGQKVGLGQVSPLSVLERLSRQTCLFDM